MVLDGDTLVFFCPALRRQTVRGGLPCLDWRDLYNLHPGRSVFENMNQLIEHTAYDDTLNRFPDGLITTSRLRTLSVPAHQAPGGCDMSKRLPSSTVTLPDPSITLKSSAPQPLNTSTSRAS